MKIGFIGLGHLGKALAERLLACGHSLVVWNRTAGKSEGMAVEVAESPAALADAVELVCLSLFDSRAVRDLLSGEQGVLAGAVAGKTVVDFSTSLFP